MYILGAGGHAGVVIDALRTKGVIPIGAINRTWGEVNGVTVLGDDDYITQPTELANGLGQPVELANGLGNKATRQDSGLELRASLYRKFRDLGCTFPPIVHLAAIVSESATLSDGAQILAGAIVQTAARIGHNAIINTRAVVEHDCVVGDHCHVAPGAILCGGVQLGWQVHIGAGAIVLPGLKIANGSVVAAGAVVTKDVAGFAGRMIANGPAPKPQRRQDFSNFGSISEMMFPWQGK